MRGSAAALLVTAIAGFAALGGCGSKSDAGDRIPGRTLRIYASVPLHGASHVSGRAIVNGASLALAQLHGRIGRYRILLEPLDDSTIGRDQWDPGQTTQNARLAAQDPTTIGYIGELNSGASAVSIPILNRAGIPQISPGSTAVGLTSSGPGASPGEPQKYYPTGERTFVRLVPNDAVQAAAQVMLQRSLGCAKTYVFDDNEVDGEDTASSFVAAAQQAGLQIVNVQAFEARATDYSSLAAAVAQSGADCVLISAITDSNAVAFTSQIAHALPHVRIFGSAGVAESTYTDPGEGGISGAVGSRVLITAANLDPAAYPPLGQAFVSSYSERYGAPEPAAIYGYEAMSLMLNAISRATHDGTGAARRSAVVSALLHTRDRHSVLGTYSIRPSGDTTVTRYEVYKVLDGRLTFWKAIDA